MIVRVVFLALLASCNTIQDSSLTQDPGPPPDPPSPPGQLPSFIDKEDLWEKKAVVKGFKKEKHQLEVFYENQTNLELKLLWFSYDNYYFVEPSSYFVPALVTKKWPFPPGEELSYQRWNQKSCGYYGLYVKNNATGETTFLKNVYIFYDKNPKIIVSMDEKTRELKVQFTIKTKTSAKN